MFKKIFLIFILCTSFASATYINNDTIYCSKIIDSSSDFLTVCPPDHRDETNWLKYYHYTNNYSVARCVNSIVIYDNCPFELLDWKHPTVTGQPSWSQGKNNAQTEQLQQVPEFTTVGAALALVGASYFSFRKRKKI